MVWDATAINVTIKALGSVESGMNYGSVNHTDPITIGLIQWYGTRAANLLFSIQSGASSDFTAHCPASIVSDMSSHPATDHFWNYRHVTDAEIAGLYDLLTTTAVIAIQNSQISTDLAGYLDAGQAWGIDKDLETEAMEFFCTIYNQSPVAANQCANSVPANCTLDNIYQAALNNGIVGKYRNRQNTAYHIVQTQDTSGIGSSTGTPPPDNTTLNGGGSNGNGTQPQGRKGSILTPYGDSYVMYNSDGSQSTLMKSSAFNHIVASDSEAGTPNTSGPTPSNPGGNVSGPPTPGGAAAVIAWERSVLGTYAYSQAAGRQNPPRSGFTDCSSLQEWAFTHYANVDLGGWWVGAQYNHGTLISTDHVAIRAETGLVPGDLIYFRWGPTPETSSPYDHIGLYTDTHTMISQQGRTGSNPSGIGPTERPWAENIDYAISNGGAVMVRRFL